MKSLKAILLVCLLSLGFISANAQGFDWGVKAGLNVSTVTNGGDAVKYKPGFNVGVFGQYMFSGNEGFGLEAGLQYSMLGFKGKADGISETYNASYIQLPIQALYKFRVGQNLLLYPSLGIYLGYGVGGTNFAEVSMPGYSESIGYFDIMEEFDLGLKVGLNLQFEKILIGVGYEYGFLDVPPGDEEGKNSNIFLSVGYIF